MTSWIWIPTRLRPTAFYSSHMADAGTSPNSAYDVSNATVKTHAVWWLYPTTCLMRYPGRSSMIVLNIIPVGPDRTLETYDFFLETPEPDAMELDAIRYLDEVLQVEDISLVESVQRGMNTPAFTQGRIVNDPDGSGKSEHAVHHFHGLVLDAYAKGAAVTRPNILVIMADQLAPHFTGVYGHKVAKTPHLDALAARGMRFDAAYCNSPLCAYLHGLLLCRASTSVALQLMTMHLSSEPRCQHLRITLNR